MAEIWGAALATAATVYGANKAAKASKSAANAQGQSADQAAQVQWDMYQQNRQDTALQRAGGNAAFSEYLANIGITPAQTATTLAASDPGQAYLMANPDVAADVYYGKNPLEHYNQYGKREGRTWGAVAAPAGSGITAAPNTSQTMQDAFAKFRSTPGYQFGLTEGQRALESSAAASGGLFSGKAGKALTAYGQNYADQQGYSPYLDRLAGAAGIAQRATDQVGQYGQNTANQVGRSLLSAGDARASGIQNSANIWGSAAGQLGGIAGQYFGNRWGGI